MTATGIATSAATTTIAIQPRVEPALFVANARRAAVLFVARARQQLDRVGIQATKFANRGKIGPKLAERHENLGGRHVGVELANPDFVKLGEAFGVNAVRVSPDQVGRAVREARERGGVWLIEVPFAPEGSVNRVPWMP